MPRDCSLLGLPSICTNPSKEILENISQQFLKKSKRILPLIFFPYKSKTNHVKQKMQRRDGMIFRGKMIENVSKTESLDHLHFRAKVSNSRQSSVSFHIPAQSQRAPSENEWDGVKSEKKPF